MARKCPQSKPGLFGLRIKRIGHRQRILNLSVVQFVAFAKTHISSAHHCITMHSDYPRDYYSDHYMPHSGGEIARRHGDHHHTGHHHGSHHSGHGHHSGSHSKHAHHHRNDDHQKHRDPHHDRHLAEGAIAAAGIAEAVHHHRKKEGEDVSQGFGHLARTVGAGALGAIAANEISRARDSHDSKHSHSSSGHHHRDRHGHRHHH